MSTRQDLVPDELLGRITSAHRIITLGAGPVGALAAGFLGHEFGLRAPILLAAALLGAGALAAPVLLKAVEFPAR